MRPVALQARGTECSTRAVTRVPRATCHRCQAGARWCPHAAIVASCTPRSDTQIDATYPMSACAIHVPSCTRHPLIHRQLTHLGHSAEPRPVARQLQHHTRVPPAHDGVRLRCQPHEALGPGGMCINRRWGHTQGNGAEAGAQGRRAGGGGIGQGATGGCLVAVRSSSVRYVGESLRGARGPVGAPPCWMPPPPGVRVARALPQDGGGAAASVPPPCGPPATTPLPPSAPGGGSIQQGGDPTGPQALPGGRPTLFTLRL